MRKPGVACTNKKGAHQPMHLYGLCMHKDRSKNKMCAARNTKRLFYGNLSLLPIASSPFSGLILTADFLATMLI